MGAKENYFKELVDNGIDFINKAISELDEDKHSPEGLKYSTIHLYQGIELLLKSIIAKEHWTLVLSNIGKIDYEQYRKGDFHSIGYEDIISRLQNCCQIKIDERLARSFDELRKLRNKYIHFHCVNSTPSILNTQYKAWHYSFMFVQQDVFLFDDLILKHLRNIEKKMLKNTEFIDARYKEVGPKINELTKKQVVIYRCLWCDRESIYFDGEMAKWICLVCNDEYDPEDLAQKAYDVEYHPKHNPDFAIGNCGNCDFEAVIPVASLGREDENEYLCLNCGEKWKIEDRESCATCGRVFLGIKMEAGMCSDCWKYQFNKD